MKDTISAITGKNRVCGVIGDPICHSLSPVIHNTLATRLGDRMTYVPFHVTRDGLEAAIKGAHALGIRGLNVTMPHKQSLEELVVGVDESARRACAINTLVYEAEGYRGYNTDIYGVEKSLEQMGCDYTGQNVAIIGSGGAAYAAAVCVAQKAGAIHLFNRTRERAEALSAHIGQYTDCPIHVHEMAEQVPEAMYLVIQTTGVGMGQLVGLVPECSEPCLAGAQYALEMIYSPWETAFLRAARSRGIVCSNGFPMLYYQAVKAYELMNGPIQNEGISETIKQEIENFVENEWLKKDLH